MNQKHSNHEPLKTSAKGTVGSPDARRGWAGKMMKQLLSLVLMICLVGFCLLILGFCIILFQDRKFDKWEREAKATRQLLPEMGTRAAEIAKSLENAPIPEGLPQTIEFPALAYRIDWQHEQYGPMYLQGDAKHSEVYLGKGTYYFNTSAGFMEFPSVDLRSVRTFVIVIEDDCHSYRYEYGAMKIMCTDKTFVAGKDSGKLTAYRSFAPGEPPKSIIMYQAGDPRAEAIGEGRERISDEEIHWLESLPATQSRSSASEVK
jgi:hypothetical protein